MPKSIPLYEMRHISMTFLVVAIILVYFVGIMYMLLIHFLYFVFFCKKPQLIYKQTKNNAKISKMASLDKRFCPFIPAIPGLIQSFIYRLKNAKKKTATILFERDNGIFLIDDYQNENTLIIRHKDYDQICEIAQNCSTKNNNPSQIVKQVRKQQINYGNRDSVLLVHGFNSSSDSYYIVSLAHRLMSDYNVFAFNSRGTKINLLTFQYYHVGFTDDVEHVLNYLLSVTKGQISIVGFSLGANWSAILMAKIKNKRVVCGVGVSMPFDFVKLNQSMLSRYNIYLNRVITKKMRGFLYKHIKTFLVPKRRMIGADRKAHKEAAKGSPTSGMKVKLKNKNQTAEMVREDTKTTIKFDKDRINLNTRKKNMLDTDQIDKRDLESITVKNISDCKLMHHVDKNITARVFKFNTLEEFYKNGSSVNYFERIKRPFLVINACDDPIIPRNTINIDKVKSSDHVFLVLTAKGGHLGFVEYSWETTYIEEIIFEFLSLYLTQG